MALEFKLPDIGEGIAEGEIVKWLVSEGDTVEEHQAIVEVMTDKATVEVPAPSSGVISALRASEGDVVPVGDVIFVLDGDGGGAAASKQETKEESKQASKEESKPEKAEPAPAEKQSSAPKSKPSSGGGGTLEFKLPDIGEGVAEGEIVSWSVQEGDTVEEHQTVVEVMTDKATVEIPSPAPGVIQSIKAAAGDVVPVGSVIFELQTSGGGQAPEPVGAAASSASGTASQSGQAAASTPTAAPRPDGKVLAVPSARRVAREMGIDLSSVAGTGRNGVIRRADVESFAESGGAAAPAPAAAAPKAKPAPQSLPVGDRETRVAFRGVRRKIAEAMTRSMSTAVHFTVVEELDVTELVKLRAEAKAIGAEQGVKVTYMPFIMKAVANALFKFPELNSKLDETTDEIVTYHYVNLGIATDTEQGLIVPVIDDVQAKGLLQLSSELQDMAERTRAGKVKPDELRGGTFTITNAGNIGGTLATPVINFPEVAILGVHRIMKRPGVVETPEGEAFEVRHYMNLSISVDHRLVDGASAARFLVYMKRLLENPGLLSL